MFLFVLSSPLQFILAKGIPMKRVLIVLSSCLALTGWSQVAHADSCSCTAPDRSCSASINCANGCWSSCSAGGHCSSGCGGGGIGGIDYQNYSSAAPRAEPFSWSTQEGVSAADLSQRVSEHFGVPFAYVPDNPKEALNVDLKGLSLADVRHFLARSGAVASADRDPATSWGQAARYTVRADNARVARIGEALSRVSGGTFNLAPAEPQSRMTLDIKGVTAADLNLIFTDVEHPIRK